MWANCQPMPTHGLSTAPVKTVIFPHEKRMTSLIDFKHGGGSNKAFFFFSKFSAEKNCIHARSLFLYFAHYSRKTSKCAKPLIPCSHDPDHFREAFPNHVPFHPSFQKSLPCNWLL